MDGKYLSEAIDLIDEKYINEAALYIKNTDSDKLVNSFEYKAVPEEKNMKRRVFGIIISAAACAAVVIALCRMPGDTPPENDYYKNAVKTVTSVTYSVTGTSALENTYAEETKTEVPVSSENTVPVIITAPETVTVVYREASQIQQTFPVRNTEEIRIETVSEQNTEETRVESVSDQISVTEEQKMLEMKEKLTVDTLCELVIDSKRRGYELTWSDFEKYEYEDIGSGFFIYKYKIESSEESGEYLLIGGDSLDERPEYMFLNNGDEYEDNTESMDIRSEDFWKLLLWLLEPEDDETNRSDALKLGEYALNEYRNGNYTLETSIGWNDADEMMSEEMAKLMGGEELMNGDKIIVFSNLSFVDEHTVILTLNKGLHDVHGYLITDGSVSYKKSDRVFVPGRMFDGGCVDITNVYGNVYYFYAGL
ncbi:MAG: hypothetical protein ACI4KB_06915 [Oscillospiraceae bacterium]